jgi:hypothetical protein
MVKKITTLVALVSLFTAFNAVKAQEMFNKETIHQGETLKLGNYVSVVSKEQAKNLKDVKTCSSADNPILQQLGEELNSYLISTESNSNDTIFVQADSIQIEKKIYDYKDKMLDERYVAIFTDGQKYSLSYAKDVSMSDAITYSLITGLVKNITINSTELKDNDTISLPKEELNKELEKILNKYIDNSKKEEYKNEINININTRKKDLLDINLACGVGYLNWANNGFYSVPQSSDPFSLKYGLKTDLILQFIVFPKSLISISTGIGQQSNIFEFRNGFDNYEFTTNPTSNNYSIESNSLIAYYITVPLTIDFNLNKDFRIHIGAMGGINYNTSWSGFVRSYKEKGETTTQQSGSAFSQFNPFKLDAMFGISFSNFTFYANYALTDMFESTYKFQARPFSFGLMIWY